MLNRPHSPCTVNLALFVVVVAVECMTVQVSLSLLAYCSMACVLVSDYFRVSFQLSIFCLSNDLCVCTCSFLYDCSIIAHNVFGPPVSLFTLVCLISLILLFFLFVFLKLNASFFLIQLYQFQTWFQKWILTVNFTVET